MEHAGHGMPCPTNAMAKLVLGLGDTSDSLLLDLAQSGGTDTRNAVKAVDGAERP
jgi:hypothetical protein